MMMIDDDDDDDENDSFYVLGLRVDGLSVL